MQRRGSMVPLPLSARVGQAAIHVCRHQSGHPILMVGVHTAVPQLLIPLLNVANEVIGFEDTIVGQVVSDYHTMPQGKLLKVLFSSYGLSA